MTESTVPAEDSRFPITEQASASNSEKPQRGFARLPRLLAESGLVVISILLALAVDEWNEDRERQEIADRSLVNFAQEIQQNWVRLQDVTPFHAGLREVLSRMSGQKQPSIETFRNVIDGFQPAILLNTAWETALATGVLSYMEYETVAALSQTYSRQERVDALNRAGVSDLLLGGVHSSDPEMLIFAANRYMRDLTEREQELQAVYATVLELLGAETGVGADPRDAAHP